MALGIRLDLTSDELADAVREEGRVTVLFDPEQLAQIPQVTQAVLNRVLTDLDEMSDEEFDLALAEAELSEVAAEELAAAEAELAEEDQYLAQDDPAPRTLGVNVTGTDAEDLEEKAEIEGEKFFGSGIPVEVVQGYAARRSYADDGDPFYASITVREIL